MDMHVAQLIFTKGLVRHDRMDAIRLDGSIETVDCPKQGIIPHDMVRHAVEITLRKRGFVSRVLGGEVGAYRMGPEPESDSVERLVEVIQADGWSGWTNSLADLLDLYQTTCAARGCDALSVSPADMDAVRRCTLQLTEQWQAIPAGGSLKLEL